eukprot:4966947-Prymnesium_polylepis.1
MKDLQLVSFTASTTIPTQQRSAHLDMNDITADRPSKKVRATCPSYVGAADLTLPCERHRDPLERVRNA